MDEWELPQDLGRGEGRERRELPVQVGLVGEPRVVGGLRQGVAGPDQGAGVLEPGDAGDLLRGEAELLPEPCEQVPP
nr:hypothetical protein [Mobilicoccus sp.]